MSTTDDIIREAQRTGSHIDLHGFCAFCGLRWPCDYAGLQGERDEALTALRELRDAAIRALISDESTPSTLKALANADRVLEGGGE